jgi:hypothetical protein
MCPGQASEEGGKERGSYGGDDDLADAGWGRVKDVPLQLGLEGAVQGQYLQAAHRPVGHLAIVQRCRRAAQPVAQVVNLVAACRARMSTIA